MVINEFKMSLKMQNANKLDHRLKVSIWGQIRLNYE